ncbi:galectin-8-like [Corythoichthys intestinalis]|uniref:galectin-8-like n=1 Tax=Corythoichthys intestinalis TaxID=161448 RepID=UPI0025A51C0E|nr:galectin-8-like [Corythoichthys intestinalis]
MSRPFLFFLLSAGLLSCVKPVVCAGAKKSKSLQMEAVGTEELDFKEKLVLEAFNKMVVSGKVKLQVEPCADPENLPSGSYDDILVYRKLKMKPTKTGQRGEVVGGLRVGRSIVVRGRVNQDPERITVNLVSDKSDTALHLGPRFNSLGYVNVIVANSRLAGVWGTEESHRQFPFAPGQYFELVILCETDSFSVTVNGQHQLDYNYRVVDLKSITAVDVHGDMTLIDVRMK